jgi:hypothetical protein
MMAYNNTVVSEVSACRGHAYFERITGYGRA